MIKKEQDAAQVSQNCFTGVIGRLG